MDFARKQLEKYGWKDGEGLGKHSSGISKPIKAKLKFDSCGLGHKISDELINPWWQRVYDSAAKNVEVSKDEESVKVKTLGDNVKITTKRSKREEVIGANGFTNFLKRASLTGQGEKSMGNDLDGTEDEEETDYTIVTSGICDLTEEKLFKLCGGRTAHKGARHGLSMSAKLARLEQHENTEVIASKIAKKMKKKRNKACDAEDIDEPSKSPEVVPSKKSKRNKVESSECDEESQETLVSEIDSVDSKKRKKKKEKQSEGVEELPVSPSVTDHVVDESEVCRDDTDSSSPKKQKKKKSKEKHSDAAATAEEPLSLSPSIELAVDVNEVLLNNAESSGKHKKKKSKKKHSDSLVDTEGTESVSPSVELAVDENEHLLIGNDTEVCSPRKSKKKKSKDKLRDLANTEDGLLVSTATKFQADEEDIPSIRTKSSSHSRKKKKKKNKRDDEHEEPVPDATEQ